MDEATVFNVMAEAMQARGAVTAEQVASDRAAMDAAANSNAPAAEPFAATNQSQNVPVISAPDLNAMDAAIYAGASTPGQYRFETPFGADLGDYDHERDAAVRTLFHREGVPASIGSFIGTMFNKALANPMSDAQWEASLEQCRAQLSRTWGADTDKNRAVAQAEYNRFAAQEPRLNDLLTASRLGRNPHFIATMYNHAKAKGRA